MWCMAMPSELGWTTDIFKGYDFCSSSSSIYDCQASGVRSARDIYFETDVVQDKTKVIERMYACTVCGTMPI